MSDSEAKVELGRRLDSWKAISQYLGRSVTTVQRWESDEGLPVRRLPHKKRGSVFAYAGELDSWLKARVDRGIADSEPSGLPASALRGQWRSFVRLSLIAPLTLGALLIPLIWPRGTSHPAEASSALVPVTSYTGIEQHPHFSPDGRKMAFVWDRDRREYDLYVKEYPDGEPHQLTHTAEREGSPRWSPDGRFLAFARYESTATRKVYVLELNTGAERLIATLNHARRQGIYAEWTPDSKGLLVSDHLSPEAPLRIERIELEGLARTPLTSPADPAGDLYGNISPDGKLLAFARCRHELGGCDLYVKDLRSGGERRLTSAASAIWGLCWWPDSRSLVYSAGAERFQLWRIEIGGVDRGLRRLTSQVGVAMHPAIRSGEAAADVIFEHLIRHDHIWRLDLKQPESTRRPEQVTRSTWSDHTPVLSPDSRMIAFSSDQSGASEVWLAAADGSGIPRQLTRFAHTTRSLLPRGWTPNGKAVSVFPLDQPADIAIDTARNIAVDIETKGPPRAHFWSRDGRVIYFFQWENGRINLWSKQPASGQTVRLTTDRAATAAESFDGKTIFFTKYEQYPPGLWAIPATGGPERLVVPAARGDSWAVARGGIYYFDFSDGSRNRYLPRDVGFYDVATGKTSRVAHIASNGFVNLLPGFAVSPDGRWIYWSQRDFQSSDIASLRISGSPLDTTKPH